MYEHFTLEEKITVLQKHGYYVTTEKITTIESAYHNRTVENTFNALVVRKCSDGQKIPFEWRYCTPQSQVNNIFQSIAQKALFHMFLKTS